MEINKRFTLMTFPQHFDGVGKLRINILFLPRTQNPFRAAIESTPPITDPVPAFADANISFNLVIVKGLDKFPNTLNADVTKPAPTTSPLHKKELLTTLADGNHFKIENKDDSNQVLPKNANPAKPRLETIKKYLPLTYRNAFNFISPKLKGNAVTDDSYHCAVRGAAKFPGFKQSPDTVSWGNVFAFLLRNPLIAEAAGFIYKTEIDIDAADFSEGGWIYTDLAVDSDYRTALTEDNDFIKRYAARIPQLKEGEERALFAANLFPVLLKKPADAIDPSPVGNFDNVFIEAADYDDGFGKILHSFQPVSQHLLQEDSDGFHPTHDSGIRLGWDDEQLLTWYVRQMAEDESVGAGQRIDAPTGVMGFHIDVKENGTAAWNPLNKVRTKPGIDPLGGLVPQNPAAQFTGELPFQVFPSTLDGDPAKNYWLPMYFANWTGHSMVLPDEEAIKVYKHDQDVQPDFNAADPDKKGKTNVTGSPANQLLKMYDALDITTRLKYGSIYDFRIRYTDITNGGPALEAKPVNEALHPETSCHFRRYVAPTTIRLDNVPANEDGAVYDLPSLKVSRPLLSYPAVVYTNQYTNAIASIISKMDAGIAAAAAGRRAQINDVGLSDPDVDSIEIMVEVQALRMDYQLSSSGKESYAALYTTTRNFNVPANDSDYDNELEIPIEYRDAAVLKFGDTADLGDLGSNQAELDTLDQLVLPTARAIRLTIRAVCKERINYYGLESADRAYNTRYGRTSYINLYKASADERKLYSDSSLQAIYLQPDEQALARSVIKNHSEVYAEAVRTPDSVQRLAQQLKIENNGLSLVGKKGERIQFGCSARIRHTLSPDNSALTFASKEELYHHWLCCVTLDVERDWTWDALDDLSFVVTRTTNFKSSAAKRTEVVGEIDVRHSISFTALQEADRTYTRIVFIDAVEPKQGQPDSNPVFPDMIHAEYSIQAVFKKDHGAVKDDDVTLQVDLPVTTNPVQIPKIASAGIALSPYHRNDKYSSTDARRRFLWIEFAEAVKDPNDRYFARVMAYSPDQLISNNNHALEKPIADPAMNLDPEYIRVVTGDSADDNAGINAMQVMEKSLLSDRHYLLPLPSGLNESSPELFGFFTYELRVGHAHVWCTAQGRYGRPLKATGIQHPAPTLTCAVNRDEDQLYVSAPFATAVFNGKNVTANPPRTQLWCLLYAQVKQANNSDADKELKDYRNVLLEDRIMRRQANFNDPSQTNQDATKYGTSTWTNKEVEDLLAAYGLPGDLSLSVLCVEMFGHIANEKQYRTRTLRTNENAFADPALPQDAEAADAVFTQVKPLSSALGNYRILRTSPLVEVPFMCCTK